LVFAGLMVLAALRAEARTARAANKAARAVKRKSRNDPRQAQVGRMWANQPWPESDPGQAGTRWPAPTTTPRLPTAPPRAGAPPQWPIYPDGTDRRRTTARLPTVDDEW